MMDPTVCITQQTTTAGNTAQCPGCLGARVQLNTQTGIRELCPVCHGTGRDPQWEAYTQYVC